MVMQYIAGQDLGDFLQANGALPLSQVHAIAQDVASALDYAHAQGVVHRDIKASNVMLEPVTATGQGTKSFRAVLMDFGLVKIMGGGTRLTQQGMMGTLDYIAPEQIQDSAEVDARADVYAFGVLVYQMLTGELPFKNHNPGALILAHLQQPAPDPRALAPSLSEGTAHAICQALAKHPTDRLPSAGTLAAALA
jgi:serine/threonine-protein kinase